MQHIIKDIAELVKELQETAATAKKLDNAGIDAIADEITEAIEAEIDDIVTDHSLDIRNGNEVYVSSQDVDRRNLYNIVKHALTEFLKEHDLLVEQV